MSVSISTVPQVEDVRRQLERWRSARTHPSPIPEELWASAVKLARRHGVEATARALALNAKKLQARVARRSEWPPESPAFVELLPANAPDRAACVIEVERGRGDRLRIQLSGAAMAEVGAVLRMLWQKRA